MRKSLRVLLLEDCKSDARLVLHALKQAGFDPDPDLVDAEPDFLARLRPAPDIILADYHLPQFDALRALEALQGQGLDIPLIVITGALGDEVAVDCLKRGAADYLLKDRLARLGPAVEQALAAKRLRDAKREADTALRRAQDELEERVRQRTADLEAANQRLHAEIVERGKLQQNLAAKVHELEEAMAQVKRLEGLLPICAWCKKIRDTEDYWHEVEEYVHRHSEAQFSHGICPECLEREMTPFKDRRPTP